MLFGIIIIIILAPLVRDFVRVLFSLALARPARFRSVQSGADGGGGVQFKRPRRW